MSSRRAAILLITLLGLAVATAGCSMLGSAGPDRAVNVTGAWVRPSPAGGVTAAYFTVSNPGSRDDVLVGVSTPDAQSAALHQTSTDASGMTGMAETASITIPAGGTVELKAGGYHVMIEGVARDLVIGGSIQLVLTFEQAGVVRVTAEVKGG
jgi:copper(I)-binding protein